jgi:hypothetical protein
VHTKPGFTFIEVVLALFMVSGLLTAIMLLQGTIFRNLVGFSNSLQRIFYLKNKFAQVEHARAQGTDLPKLGKEDVQKIENPPTTITYVLKKPSSKSALKEFSSAAIEQATAQWQEFGREQKEVLVSFLYYPPKKEP